MPSNDNIILFIPLDMSVLDGQDEFNNPKPSNENNFMMYEKISEEKINFNADDLVYNPIVPEDSKDNNDNFERNPFILEYPVVNKQEDGDFSNVYIQLTQCNKHLEWASSTNIHCYNCCHAFTTRPWYLPVDYVDGCFIVFPIFCSPACTLRFNLESEHADFSKRCSLFHLMYNIIHSTTTQKIPIALPRETLDIFGGPMNITDYRNYSDSGDKLVEVSYPEIYSIVPQIQYIQRKKENGNNDYALKRMKPPRVIKNSIFNTLLKKPV
jgi:hypothetical protein